MKPKGTNAGRAAGGRRKGIGRYGNAQELKQERGEKKVSLQDIASLSAHR